MSISKETQSFLQAELHKAMSELDYGRMAELFKAGAKATTVELDLARNSGDIKLVGLFEKLHMIHRIEASPILEAAKAISESWDSLMDHVDFNVLLNGCDEQSPELNQPINLQQDPVV
jgi:hypothetical protein